MRTLHLRNVPDEAAAALEDLARLEVMSLNALAVRELTQAARRERNRAPLDDLPDPGISAEDVVAAVQEGRRGR